MNVLIVCTGNLCRSPMAEMFLRRLASSEGRQDIEVRSAGTHALEGNPSPPEAVKVAASAGIDLSEHRAQPLSRELVDWADQILVMEPEHAEFIEMNFPEGIEKVDELARYRPNSSPGDVMRDPYGLPIFYYRQYFGDLAEALQYYFGGLSKSA